MYKHKSNIRQSLASAESKRIESERNHNGSGGFRINEQVSFGGWVFILFLLVIPIVNIIALIVLAVDEKNESLKNFARAMLVMILIGGMGVWFYNAIV
ncbi:hypothetical protein [Halalkalibacillus halophilus]|uniref:hypothetical protein n=1 Tax=Halalkalibacillus halophilus TaxID=392827 RepID=UPI000418E8CE|nr:hypothetical protein [Halalkalibacillus halophilus]